MAKKNTDAKSFNRTGIYSHQNGTVLYEDKNGTYLFDLTSKLADFDGEEVSISVTTDMNPDHVKDEE